VDVSDPVFKSTHDVSDLSVMKDHIAIESCRVDGMLKLEIEICCGISKDYGF